jgi:hypothetical protein
VFLISELEQKDSHNAHLQEKDSSLLESKTVENQRLCFMAGTLLSCISKSVN